jgi:DNA-binding CsgD family transcriptional regulator
MSAPYRRNALDLSPRQDEMLRLAVAGLSNATIARRLWVSPKTVDATLHTAHQRLGFFGKRGALAAAYVLGRLDAGQTDEARRLCPALREASA